MIEPFLNKTVRRSLRTRWRQYNHHQESLKLKGTLTRIQDHSNHPKVAAYLELERHSDKAPLGYAYGVFNFNRHPSGRWLPAGNEVQDLQTEDIIPGYKALRANQRYRGLGTALLRELAIISFRLGHHGYLQLSADPSAATFYRRVGWTINGLHQPSFPYTRTPSQDILHQLQAEAQTNRKLDALIAANKKLPNKSLDDTLPMRITEGLGLPSNWQSPPLNASPKEKVQHHAQQLKAHIARGDHLANPLPVSKLGVMQFINARRINLHQPID